MQKKAHEVDAWLARPDPRIGIVLVYGPDRGLVSERAQRFAAATGLALDDPFQVIRFDAGDLEQHPGRLEDEARTVPMFGGTRLLWVRNAGSHKGFADAVAALAASPSPDVSLLIEAGDLKKGAPLRAAVENAPAGMALPCFADEARSIGALIDAELSEAGLRIGIDARAALARRLGGDRMASRGELRKLVLYCAGAAEVTVEDVEASTGDVSTSTVDQAVDAVLAGAPAEADRAAGRLAQAGVHAQQSLGAAMRQFQSLALLRRNMDVGGMSASAAVAAARPPVFFAHKAAVEAAVAVWSGPAIVAALARLQDAILSTRRRPDLTDAMVRQTFLLLAMESRRLRRRR